MHAILYPSGNPVFHIKICHWFKYRNAIFVYPVISYTKKYASIKRTLELVSKIKAIFRQFSDAIGLAGTLFRTAET